VLVLQQHGLGPVITISPSVLVADGLLTSPGGAFMQARCFITALSTVLLIALPISSAQAEPRFKDKFEDNSLDGFKHVRGSGGKAEIVNNPRAGNYSARLSTEEGDRVRSQLVIGDGKGKPNRFENGREQYIAFSNRLDESWEFDKKRGDIVFTVHKTREAGDKHGKQPVTLYAKKGRWELAVRGDENKNSKGFKGRRYDLGPVEKGKWNDWVIRYKPSYKGDGELDVYKDGKKVIEDRGPNAFNDKKPGYAAVGIYRPKGGSKVGKRIIDVDEIKVGDKFEDVASEAPGGGGSTPDPEPNPEPEA
jgi:hypothetical protein